MSTATPSSNPEQRALLKLATAKDATLVGAVLDRAGIESHHFETLGALSQAWGQGAGALLIAEEMLAGDDWAALKARLQAQEAWSDVPLLVLARAGADSAAIQTAMDEIANVTVIERPVRVAALVSALRSGLRARRRQLEMRDLLDGLREADRRKNEFLATLAHELRNPMAPIGNAIALLERDPQRSDDHARLHRMMRRQLDHLVRLVDDLMELSRVTRGKVELQRTSLSLDLPLADALEQSRAIVESRRHRVVVDADAPAPVVTGDRVRLAQVFTNLIVNAAKYTPPGGTIRVAVGAHDGNAVIQVADDGIGLGADTLDSIFDMFVQLAAAAQAAPGGLGIGLTLVKSLVELHGGTVSAASDGADRGATFTVRLPLQSAPVAGDTGGPASAAGRLNLRVLVADDNRDAADSLSEVLNVLGARTSVVYDAQAALVKAGFGGFDAAILDIGMPPMGGCELAERLRAAPVTKHMKLIALTGLGSPVDHERILRAGFDRHLLKPADLGELTQALSEER